MTTEELKRCPFCGGEVVYRTQLGEDNWIEHKHPNNCALCFDDFNIEGSLIKAWNTRATIGEK